MNFQEALLLLKEGKKLRRTGWSFSTKAYLELLPCNSSMFLYLMDKYQGENSIEGYGLQFTDLESFDWELLENRQ